MKKIISLLTTGIMCMGVCLLPAYAEETIGNLLTADSTPEEILNAVVSEDKEFSDGGIIYTDKYKIDVISDSSDEHNIATVVVYGFEDTKQLRNNRPVINTKDYFGAAPATELHSGYKFHIFGGITEKSKLGEKQGISIYYFANNSIRDLSLIPI